MTENYQKEVNQIVKTLKEKYRPEKIILFGSLAYGKVKEDSDIDLLIVKRTSKSKLERLKEVLMMVDNNLPFEPVVYTPQELKRRLSMGDFFIQDIIKRGKVLYEKEL